MTDTPAISIPTENESSDTTALVSEPDSVCRKSAGGAPVARGKNAGQIIVSDESGSKQLVPYQGTQGGSLVVRPDPVKGEVVPYEKKQYLPAVIPRLGDLDAYIRYANAAPILSAEEEHALAVRLRDEGDLMAAQQLILSHLRLVVSIARGFLGYGLPHADLIQEGNIGLMKAIKHFDPDRGVRLMTFSVHWIRSEIQEYIVRNWRMVKLATTKNQRKLFFNLRQMKADEKSLSTSETERIAETLDVKPEEVREMEARLSAATRLLKVQDRQTLKTTMRLPPLIGYHAKKTNRKRHLKSATAIASPAKSFAMHLMHSTNAVDSLCRRAGFARTTMAIPIR